MTNEMTKLEKVLSYDEVTGELTRVTSGKNAIIKCISDYKGKEYINYITVIKDNPNPNVNSDKCKSNELVYFMATGEWRTSIIHKDSDRSNFKIANLKPTDDLEVNKDTIKYFIKYDAKTGELSRISNGKQIKGSVTSLNGNHYTTIHLIYLYMTGELPKSLKLINKKDKLKWSNIYEPFILDVTINHEKVKELIDYNPKTGIITSKKDDHVIDYLSNLHTNYLIYSFMNNKDFYHSQVFIHKNGDENNYKFNNIYTTDKIEDKDDVSVEDLKDQYSYNPKTGIFISKKTLVESGTINKQNHGYVLLRVNNKHQYAHRMAYLYMEGLLPTDEIDHINRNPSDNRYINLRTATRSQNMQNKNLSSKNKSGVTGVFYNKKLNIYQANISHNSKMIYLGSKNTFEEAVELRLEAEKKYGYLGINQK